MRDHFIHQLAYYALRHAKEALAGTAPARAHLPQRRRLGPRAKVRPVRTAPAAPAPDPRAPNR